MALIRERLEFAWPRWDWIRVFICRIMCWPCGPKVVAVRHANYAGATTANPDPPLNQAGQDRAQVLTHAVERVGITHIFTSEFKRTKDTAAPLAALLGLTPTVVAAADTTGLLNQLRQLPSTGAALVVGHSDTVPPVVAGL